MNSKTLIGLVAFATLAVLLGCSTSKPASAEQATSPSVQSPAIEWRYSQLIPPPPAMEPPGKICLLGTTCLAMDPRPFEPCLLSSKRCRDKAAEPMEVAPPREFIPEPEADSIQVTYVAEQVQLPANSCSDESKLIAGCESLQESQ